MKGVGEIFVLGAILIGLGLALRYGKSSIGLAEVGGSSLVQETQALTLSGTSGNPGYFGP
jgi:hypothetical protein